MLHMQAGGGENQSTNSHTTQNTACIRHYYTVSLYYRIAISLLILMTIIFWQIEVRVANSSSYLIINAMQRTCLKKCQIYPTRILTLELWKIVLRFVQ